MTISEFVSYLHDLDVKLWSKDGKLRLDAPKGVITPDLRTELVERKAEILALLQTANTAEQSSRPQIKPASRHGKLPLSFSQQRLWFLEQLEPENVAYNIPAVVRLEGTLNIPVFEQSLREIVRRHEVLRTTFVVEDGEPFQRINAPGSFSLSIIDLRKMPESEREDEAQRLAMEEARCPFDLAQGPLFRATLIRLTEAEYLLLVSMHHIVSDGWSIGLFFQELCTLYTSFLQNNSSPLPELSIQYADFAHWQRHWLQGEVLETQLTYWKQQLGDNLPILELPTDYPRPTIQTFRGEIQHFTLASATLKALKTFSQQQGVSLFMTLLALFKILLYRYTGQPDVVVGSPIANRNQIETEQLIGFFVNNLVLRTDLSGNPSFQELVKRVREVTLGADAHQDLPFELLVEALQVERDVSRSPLFQVMFIFQNAPRQEITLPGLTLQPVRNRGGTAKFDLTVDVREQSKKAGNYPADLYISFEYNTDLFEAATITRMMAHFQTLLEAVAVNPERHILDLPLLTAAEEQQLLVEWNDTAVDYPKDHCLPHLIEAQAKKRPDAVAVVFGDQQLTYGELNRRANQLAHHLQKLGVGPEALIGIYVERSPEMVIGLLGILKAGGAYLPLDPAFPAERLVFMIEDGQIEVLLSQSDLAGILPLTTDIDLVLLDSDWPEISQENEMNPTNAATAENLAYVLYTSGSTGKPKGVQIPHHALVNFLTSMQRKPGLTAKDVFLAVTTLSFDIAGLEIFLPLISGARLVVASRSTTKDGHQLIENLEQHDVTVMQATPSTWRMLVEIGWQGKPDLKILCGGEALPRDLAAFLLSRSAELWNMYGPTETTIWSAVEKIETADSIISIGRPINNTQVYILDKNLQPLPIGVPGELYIGGDGVARGYLNRPELTAERFIPNPFSKNEVEKLRNGRRVTSFHSSSPTLYKTGDQAHFLPDGRIVCLGRLDHQVKVRGFRIELGEIEFVLSQHPGVHQAVVVVREDQPGDKRLVAYLAAEQGPPVANDELRHFIRQQLPDYMTPSAYVWLDTLPLTPNRKIDRKALPAPDNIRPDLHINFTAPRSPLEEQVAYIWSKLLQIESIGVQDNFFELGGHSLLATRLTAALDKELDTAVPLRTIFERPTIAELAQYITQQGNGQTRSQPTAETTAKSEAEIIKEVAWLLQSE